MRTSLVSQSVSQYDLDVAWVANHACGSISRHSDRTASNFSTSYLTSPSHAQDVLTLLCLRERAGLFLWANEGMARAPGSANADATDEV